MQKIISSPFGVSGILEQYLSFLRITNNAKVEVHYYMQARISPATLGILLSATPSGAPEGGHTRPGSTSVSRRRRNM